MEPRKKIKSECSMSHNNPRLFFTHFCGSFFLDTSVKREEGKFEKNKKKRKKMYSKYSNQIVVKSNRRERERERKEDATK